MYSGTGCSAGFEPVSGSRSVGTTENAGAGRAGTVRERLREPGTAYGCLALPYLLKTLKISEQIL